MLCTEALRVVLEEGLEAGWRRHRQVHEVFIREMRKLESNPLYGIDPSAMINAIRTPRARTTQRCGNVGTMISISRSAPALGPLKGKIWRVSLMGHGARVENVDLLATALRRLI